MFDPCATITCSSSGVSSDGSVNPGIFGFATGTPVKVAAAATPCASAPSAAPRIQVLPFRMVPPPSPRQARSPDPTGRQLAIDDGKVIGSARHRLFTRSTREGQEIEECTARHDRSEHDRSGLYLRAVEPWEGARAHRCCDSRTPGLRAAHDRPPLLADAERVEDH